MSVSATLVGRRLNQIIFALEFIFAVSATPNSRFELESAGGPARVQALYVIPTGMDRRAPSKSSMYAIASPLSPTIVLFIVFGSGNIYAASPLTLRVESSLVCSNGNASSARVRNGRLKVVPP